MQLEYHSQSVCQMLPAHVDKGLASKLIAELVDAQAYPGRDDHCYVVDHSSGQEALRCFEHLQNVGFVAQQCSRLNMSKWALTDKGF